MDIGASAFNLNAEEGAKAIAEQQKTEEHFNEIIVSCGSLSKYESSKFKTLLPQLLGAAISTSFHIVVGISLAYSAILLPQLEASDSDIAITQGQKSWIASVILLIVPLGGIFGGFVMDRLGRLNTLKLAAIPGTIGWILIATSQNVTMIIIGRILTGLASSLGTSPSIVYVTEIANADMRGSLISFAPAYASLGMVLCYLKGWMMNWRIVAWLCTAYTIVPAILFFLIPESPAWLVAKGHVKRAGASLAWLYRYHPQPAHKNETLAELHLKALQKDHQQKLAEQAAYQGSIRVRKFKEFLKPTGYKPILILFGLFFFQQFAGIYITLFYAVEFFNKMGTTSISPYLASIFIGLVRFFMSCINTYMLKTHSRRPLVMISSVGMAICMLCSGAMTKLILDKSTTLTWVPCVLLVLYVITSMIGLLPIPWTMTAELFPLEIRGVAHSIAYSMANILMFLSIQSYYTLDNFFGAAGLQWFFAGVALCGGLYAFVFLPETHNKKLKDIEKYFVTNFIYLRSGVAAPKKATVEVAAPKPIVKNTRASLKDYEKNGEHNEKMIENV